MDGIWVHGHLLEKILRIRRLFGCRFACTIAYAESWDAETCKQSYFLGYDYSIDMNEQAEGRTRRAISAHEFVRWVYLHYSGTVDDHFLGELNVDLHNITKVLKNPKLLARYLLEDIVTS